MLNNELKKIKEFNVLNNDIQYQEGIFEILEIEKNIDFIILSQLLPGEIKLEELINNIFNINKKIKIILFLENYNKDLEKILINKGVYRIFYNNKIEIKDIIKIINEDDKMEKYNEEIRKEIEEIKKIIKDKKIEKNNKIFLFDKIKKYICRKINNKKIIINNKTKKNLKTLNEVNNQKINKNSIENKNIKNIINNNIENNKIISILGNNGAGKSIFTVLLAIGLKKYNNKILIIDFDILNNSLHTILGVKKYSKKINEIIDNNNFKNELNINNLIIKINKKIDLISGINLLFDSKQKNNEIFFKNLIKEISKKYDVIIVDTTSECFFEYTKEILKISDKCIFLTEANLLEISKSRRLLDLYYNNWNIEKNKINILFNKYNCNCIDINLLKNIFADYKIIGKLKNKNNYNIIINNNLKNIFFEKNINKKYEKIGRMIT